MCLKSVAIHTVCSHQQTTSSLPAVSRWPGRNTGIYVYFCKDFYFANDAEMLAAAYSVVYLGEGGLKESSVS